MYLCISIMENLLSRIFSLLKYDPSSPMLFNTGLFLVLFAIFLIGYNLLRRRQTAKMILVILFSLYFYYKSGGWCVLILLGVCVSDFFLGRWLYATHRVWMRKALVALNVVLNVGMLVYFKYINLILDAIGSIFSAGFDPLDVILPAGISFFTFRSISYMVDIYRGEMESCRNFLHYTFFLTFFPPLLAGPVVRAKDLLPQIEANTQPTPQMTAEGLFLIMIGLIKKVVIADYISGNFVDRIFENPSLYSGFENLMGCVGFTVQLYCDFSGYSDMAIGLALLLGYRFKDNFNAPFKAQSPTEFWHRWHISLSTWLRDYLYIPMGGNRKGKFRAYFNQFMTMVIGGLWHGASLMYIIWGAYHGLLLVIHKMIRKVYRLPEELRGNPLIKCFNIAFTFMLIVVGFAFFRAESMDKIMQMAHQIFYNFHLSVAPQFLSGYMVIVLAMATAYIAHITPKSWTTGATQLYISMSVVWQALLVTLVIFLVIQTRQSDLVPFIYLKY